MAKEQNIETLLRSGAAEWNRLRSEGKVPSDHTGATFTQLFSANADLSELSLVGTEWERCDLSRVTFQGADLSNAYFHGGRLQDCDFRNAKLEGCNFERLKLLRCDFTGAEGLDDLEMEEVDMDRVIGLDGEEPPPPPPPRVHGVTSFTREQRQTAQQAEMPEVDTPEDSGLPPFRPDDHPGALLARGLEGLDAVPAWVLEVPSLRPPLPTQLPAGKSFEALLREAAFSRLTGGVPPADPDGVSRAHTAIEAAGGDTAVAAAYLREVGEAVPNHAAAIDLVRATLQDELEVEDLTAAPDPRLTSACLAMGLVDVAHEAIGEVRQRLAAARLFTSLLEAGFTPEHNWEEALESHERAEELAHIAAGAAREVLRDAYVVFSALPLEVRLKRLAYLAEAERHLTELSGQAAG